MSEFSWGFAREHPLPPIDQIRQKLTYSPETGEFHWINTPTLRHKDGRPAGTDFDGYKSLRIGRCAIKQHRLAWAFMTGEWPTTNIDHINGDGLDNRWANLRAATGGINQQNVRKPSVRNSTGFLGVSRHRDKFKSFLRLAGKTLYLGSFTTPEEAHAAYVEAKRRLHPGCTL